MSIFRMIAGAGSFKRWNLAYAEYSGVSFDVSAQDTTPTGLFFKPDGTKMYIIGDSGEDVNEYDLSTAWDVSSATYLQNFSVASEDTNPRGIFFKPDGTKMYVVGGAAPDINEYDLSTPWDVSSASYLQNFSVSSQGTTATGLFFKPDGTKMYVAVFSSDPDNINEYDLSTPWDVSSATYLQNFSVASEDFYVYFKPDGSKMYTFRRSFLASVKEYKLITPWDVSSASFIQSFGVTSQDPSIHSGFFKPDGTKMYVVGNDSDTIYEYTFTA